MSFYLAMSNAQKKKEIVQEKKMSYWPASIFYSVVFFLFGLGVYGLPLNSSREIIESYIEKSFWISVIGSASFPWELQYLPVILSFVSFTPLCEARYEATWGKYRIYGYYGYTMPNGQSILISPTTLALHSFVFAGALRLTFLVIMYIWYLIPYFIEFGYYFLFFRILFLFFWK
jgi:hypothetical protein